MFDNIKNNDELKMLLKIDISFLFRYENHLAAASQFPFQIISSVKFIANPSFQYSIILSRDEERKTRTLIVHEENRPKNELTHPYQRNIRSII